MGKTDIYLRNRHLDEAAVVRQVVLKIVQRCNLDCTYCYVYSRGDSSWMTRPTTIRIDVIDQLAIRIQEHCKRYGLQSFTVELHGGEPLLLPRTRMQALIDRLRDGCGAVRLHFTLQTNGTLLDYEWLQLFSRNRMTFGISLDGPPELADQKRIMRASRKGSTQRILDNIAKLRRQGPLFDELFGGVLCVVDPVAITGEDLVNWFVQNGFDAFDLLLPDGNLANLPQDWNGVAPYRDFLLGAFEQWYSMGETAPRIRKFEVMMMGLLGANVSLDALGGDLRSLCVVESDGSIGVSDVARICGGQFSLDILNIFDHSLDAHVASYNLNEVQQVCNQCSECPNLLSCGGGYLPHRFDGTGFANPSLYCDALYALSERMKRAIGEDLTHTVLETCVQ